MAGLGIRLYLDEMVNVMLAAELRRRGYDVVSCQEVGRAGKGVPDHAQLAFAAGQGRVVLTFNFGDYQRLDTEWCAASRAHAGIVLSPAYRPPGELLRAVVRHLDAVPPDTQHNLVLWLPGK